MVNALNGFNDANGSNNNAQNDQKAQAFVQPEKKLDLVVEDQDLDSPPRDEIIGRNIRAYREDQQLTQKQLADKVGVRTAAVSNWETGKTSLDFLVKANNLCLALDVSLDQILDLTQTSSGKKPSKEDLLRAWRRSRTAQMKPAPIPKGQEIQKRIGKNIEQFRKQANLTQRELAERVGVVETAVSYWENGKRSLDWLFKARNLCKVLDCELAKLANDKEPTFEELMRLYEEGQLYIIDDE
ncbi:MAG: helix-turn-helix domain-containing protein [Cyanothece sp. SIO2G6]|nr:helix-turn-helix domain-containing protein [Cyanothece sp. SIO2G6]